MKKTLSTLGLIVAFLVGQTQEQEPRQALNIGDPAPPLTLDKWLKGTPQENLQDGKVRVIEFWATWCGPCILAMPHLSHLADHYKQVAFVGMNVSERVDDAEVAQRFVDVSGAMMAYNVAYAAPKGPASRDWLSGRSGIPVSFVINADGRIGWIGHPLMGLEDAVELAVAGQLTPEAAREVDQEWADRQAKGGEYNQALKEALAENNVAEALRLNDALVENSPYMIAIASGKKYALLTAIDPKAARAYGESLLDAQGNAPRVLRSVATTIFEGSDARVLGEVKVRITGEPDYELAKLLIDKALECSNPDRETNRLLQLIENFESAKN